MNPEPRTLAPAEMVDSAHPAVVDLASRATGANDRERAVSLYYLVRDSYRYDPYDIELTVDGMRASTVIAKGHGWCVPKAALLAAASRAIGIPARLGFADVRNHLSTQRLRDTLGSDLFVWHGYSELWLGGRWVKATPAFNIELCERFRLLPLDWDGESDSIYHPFDATGQRHMEYVNQHGSFDDVPLQMIADAFAAAYPLWRRIDDEGQFERDVLDETAQLRRA
jgi:transglutaminase-like putative cysteine protease